MAPLGTLYFPISLYLSTAYSSSNIIKSGSEAENLLKSKGKVGSYLVRESRSNPNNYVLCVRCENLNVVHLIINYTVCKFRYLRK
jgi:hypothetical protein